jgi:hypothetical protein
MVDSGSPIASSAAGFPLQAREAIEAGEARRAGQHHAIRRQAQTVTDAGATVETSDADARVFGDTEGTGSQGRELGEQEEQQPEQEQATKPPGIRVDKDGQLHLDLEA